MKTMRITGFTLTVLGALALGACSTTGDSAGTPSAEPSGAMESGMPPAAGDTSSTGSTGATGTTDSTGTTDPTMPPTDTTTPTDDPTETPTPPPTTP